MDHLNLTEKQLESYKRFKESVEDVINPEWTDSEICKWLIARKFNIGEAETMLRKSVELRRRIDADKLTDEWEPPEVLKRFYPGGPGGVDKDGHPVWFDLASFLDFRGILQSVSKSDIIRYEARTIEIAKQMMREQTKKLGKPIDSATIIMDLSKVGLKHLWTPGLQLYSEVLSMTECNYPENLRMVLIINSPRIFPVIYNMLKPFLQTETQQKIKVFGSDYKQKLLEHIDADQLPKAYGGTMEIDGDPYCKICLGGEIPKSYYINNQNEDVDDMTTVTVDRGSRCKIEIEVSMVHSAIKWKFKSTTYDIGFGVMYKSDKTQQKISDMEEVIPISKVNSHRVIQDGFITCDKIGTYLVIFDNHYSWVHSKCVQYKIEVITPSLEEDHALHTAQQLANHEEKNTHL